MTLTAVLVACSLAGPALPAAYVPYDDYRLILQAELIVEGTIVAVEPRERRSASSMDLPQRPPARFTLRVDALVAGESEAKELSVAQFTDWTCASRHAPYGVGQRAVFHLAQARDKKGSVDLEAPWHVMGAGNEGEFPVIGDVVLRSSQCTPVRGNDSPLVVETFELGEHTFRGIAVRSHEYGEAVRGLRRCYRWNIDREVRSSPFDIKFLERTCTDDELAAYEGSSLTSRGLVERIRNRQRDPARPTWR